MSADHLFLCRITEPKAAAYSPTPSIPVITQIKVAVICNMMKKIVLSYSQVQNSAALIAVQNHPARIGHAVQVIFNTKSSDVFPMLSHLHNSFSESSDKQPRQGK